MILGRAQVLKCSACDRKVVGDPHLVDTRDGLEVFVESECYKLIRVSGYCVRRVNGKQESNDSLW